MLYDDRFEAKLPPIKITPMLEPWQQTLLEAAEYLRDRGWCRGSYSFGESVCLVGAIRAVQRDFDGRPYNRVKTFLRKNPESWNDFNATSKEEVIQTLEACALKGE